MFVSLVESTGTYSAVRLSQDLGKTVVVVERTDSLGGHTETYIDPITGFLVDYGILAFHNLSASVGLLRHTR